MSVLSSYHLLAQHTLHELGIIVDLISKKIIDRELATKIDVYFYLEQNRKAKKIYSDMRDDVNGIRDHYDHLCRVELAVKARWQSDYRFIATPVSLHEYFG